MYINSTPTFSLDNFEGPLELLLYLIQKEEIDICSIVIKKLTVQLMQALEKTPELDISSETLNLAATLLLLKSQKLVPQEEIAEKIEEDQDPRIEMIKNLIEYCRFKEAAKLLSLREQAQKAHFPRATMPFEKEPVLGLEDIDIENLKLLFVDMLKKAEVPDQIIKADEWQVSEKLEALRRLVGEHKQLLFSDLFNSAQSRLELIVIFLALLEMMKNQEVTIIKEKGNMYIAYETRA